MTPEGHPEKFNIGTPWHTQDAFEAAMKYRSPVEIIHGELETKIENDIMTAVQHYGIKVDKEELIKALQYDRKQYEQGWRDAEKAFKRPTAKWESYFEHNGKTYHKCSNCHVSTELILINRFCPYCGAEMLPEEEDDE